MAVVSRGFVKRLSFEAVEHVDSVGIVRKDSESTTVVQMEMKHSPVDGWHDCEGFKVENPQNIGSSVDLV